MKEIDGKIISNCKSCKYYLEEYGKYDIFCMRDAPNHYQLDGLCNGSIPNWCPLKNASMENGL